MDRLLPKSAWLGLGKVTLPVVIALLAGCQTLKFWPASAGGQHPQVKVVSDQPWRHWQVAHGQQELLRVVLNGTGLLTPIMDVQPDGQLLPDYMRTAKLYKALAKTRLFHLQPPEKTLQWYFETVAALEQSCPKRAVEPLSSCRSRGWLTSWDFMERHASFEPEMLAPFLERYAIRYLIMPDRPVYQGTVAFNMRYAPSSRPLLDIDPGERTESLKPLLGRTELVIVAVKRNWRGRVDSWTHVVARCRVPAAEMTDTGSPLQRRTDQLGRMIDYCVREGLAAGDKM